MTRSKNKPSQQLHTDLELGYNTFMKINVPHVATLANLPLENDEIKKFEKQLAETLTYIDSLSKIDTKNIEPTSHVTGLENVTREDKAAPSLTQKQALSNTDKTRDGFFEVEGILDNG
jgi:aspartyl-tRNA(Asn)/glutamyl-tRNA(Gln) amidotransferase subunit C